MSQASSSASDLGTLAACVLAEPSDVGALRTLGLALKEGSGRDVEVAVRALDAATRLFGAEGQLPMALVTAKELSTLDEPRGRRSVEQLAQDYGKGSRRVDVNANARPRPPKFGQKTPSVKGDPEAAVAAAEAALSRVGAKPVPQVPLFHQLSATSFVRLADLSQVQVKRAGSVVIEIGSPGTSFYIIARGAVRIDRPGTEAEGGGDVILSHLRGGAFFGEMALLTQSARAARATCESDSILLEVSRQGLDQLAATERELGAVLANYTRDRLLQNVMLTSALFAPLSDEARAQMLHCFKLRTVAPGNFLLVEGQPSEHLYVILSGSIDVEKGDGATPLRVATLGVGDVVGEISLLTRRPATASVRAREKMLALALARDDFNAIADRFPEVLAHLYQLANRRERDLERFLSEAVVEADDYLI